MTRFRLSRTADRAPPAPGPARPDRVQALRLRIAMLAPPWITVPPHGYGGTEAVVALLSDELVRRGHDVVLYAPPGSRSLAEVRRTLERPHGGSIGSSMHESDHVATAFADIRDGAGGAPFDVVHDHSGFTALAMADHLPVPLVHTVHGPFTPNAARFYRRHGHKGRLVAISHPQRDGAPPGVPIAAVVPRPVDVAQWPLRPVKEDLLLWVGRMDPVKGADRAIAAARLARVPLILAGPVQPGQEDYFRSRVEPAVDGRRVRYVGEIAGRRRQELYARARALLMPLGWEEPFGLVMLEALACGTPVIAFPRGAAAEIVLPGENGLLVDDVEEMASAVSDVAAIGPARCRWSVRSRFGVQTVARRYEAVYAAALGTGAAPLATAP